MRRKLRAIEQRIDPALWQAGLVVALTSIYGIELLKDHHHDARAATLAEFLEGLSPGHKRGPPLGY